MLRLLQTASELVDFSYPLAEGTVGEAFHRLLASIDLKQEVEWCPSKSAANGKNAIVAAGEHFFYRPHLMEEMDLTLEKAHVLQYALLPRTLPDGLPCRLGAVLESYCHLSGDLFGWHETPDGGLMLWMADMSGHGATAGVLSAHLKILLDDLRHIDDPSVLAGALNQNMYDSLRNTHDVLYATAAFLHLKQGRLRAAVAAHPPVLLRAPDSGLQAAGLQAAGLQAAGLRRLESGGRPLGVFSGSRYDEETVDLAPGTLLLLYTDGVLEAGNATGEEFGLERLEQVLLDADSGADVAARQIYDRVSAYQDMDFIDDDVTFLVAEC